MIHCRPSPYTWFGLKVGLCTTHPVPRGDSSVHNDQIQQVLGCSVQTFRVIKEASHTMNPSAIHYSETRGLAVDGVVALYRANDWSSADKPELLHKALLASHSLVTAWDGDTLVGLGNAISDGYLVVYYPHLLVLPEYQGRGIGTRLMQMLMARYEGFHQHMLVADGRALDFYRKCGFTRAGKTEPMWIYGGHDH